MKIKARNYLFIITKNKLNSLMYCRECGKDLHLGEITYSKRKQKYYCSDCTIRLGHLSKKTLVKFIEAKTK